MSLFLRPLGLLFVLLVTSLAPCRGQAGDLQFGLNSGHLEVPASLELMPTSGMTLEGWLYLESYPPIGFDDNFFRVLTYLGDGTDSVYKLAVSAPSGSYGKKIFFTLTTDQGTKILGSSLPIPTLVWTHVAATWDGGVMRLYINGALVASNVWSGSIQQTLLPLRIGAGTGYYYDYAWHGRLDELRLWDHARTATELLVDATAQLDHIPGLKASFHFNGGFLDETGGLTALPQGASPTIQPATSPVEPLQLYVPNHAGIGSSLNFKLRGALPNAPYFLDNSIGQQSLGTPLTAPLVGIFPLDSPLLNLTYGPSAPGVFVDYLGFTNGLGEATAVFNVPAFNYLVGMEIHSAFLYLTNLQPMVLGDISRVATTLLTGPEPVISAVMPNAGPVSGGSSIGILGANFELNSSVSFGGVPATNVVIHSSTWLTCDAPAYSITGPVTVAVISPLQVSGHAQDAFNYVPVLAASSLSPIHAAPGDTVTVSGSGIQSQTTVQVGGLSANIVSSTGSSLQFTMPAGTSCHAVVTLTNPEGQTSSLVINPGPIINSLSANSGPMAGGTTLFILGTGFAPQLNVTIGGLAAIVMSQSAGLIQVQTPAATTVGATAVVVTNPDGCTAVKGYSYF